jgi:hypothetical protein
MPIGYSIDGSRPLVVVRAWGALTDDELRAYATTLLADERFDRAMPKLMDWRAASLSCVSAAFFRGFRCPFARSAQRAFVVNSKAAFGVARMYGMLTGDDDQFTVVRDVEGALAWLGLPADTHIPLALDVAVDDEVTIDRRRRTGT